MEDNVAQTEVYHKDYNLDKKHNLDSLPKEKAVFGFFGIIHEKPVNCRFIGETENLQQAIQERFELNDPDDGMKKFMQGPWIKMLVYKTMPDSSADDRKKVVEEWTKQHNPKIDDKGEYPK